MHERGVADPVGPTLVVGAGPTGLTAALELARRGHPVRIVDKHRARQPLSKAFAVNPRSLSLLEPGAVTERLRAAGYAAREAEFHGASHDALVRISALPHRYNFMLILAQHRVEQLLEQRLAEFGVQVERGVTLVALDAAALESRAARVDCTLEHGDGRRGPASAARLFAADGAASTVRRLCGLEFRGDDMQPDWQLMDVELACPLHPRRPHVLLRGARPLFVLRLEDDVWRLVCPGGDPRALTPPGWQLGRVHWASSFTVAHRLIDTFARGRVYFGGDAAHVHSPFGARGMNQGIEDAATFAEWLHTGRLGDYAAARARRNGRVVDTVRRLSRAASSTHPITTLLRNHLLPRIMAAPAAQRRLLPRLTGLD